jgi:cytochrome c2
MKKTFILVGLFAVGCVFFYFFGNNKNKIATAGPQFQELNSEVKMAEFTISGPGFRKAFTVEELLKSKDLHTVVVEKDPAYGDKKMTYVAVPLSSIFENVNIRSMSTLSFKCLDGFSGAISKARAFNQDPSGSIAYIAIEKPNQKWPNLRPDKPFSPGPFYLIWDHPEKSKIMTDEWPYQLAGLELSEATFESQFPKTQPAEGILHTDPIRKGYSTFMTSCFVCHAMNGDGENKIGPDLNIPFSPNEYLQFKHFATLVRNPQNLRKWSQARMPGFPSSDISDDDLKNIWLYLGHMTSRKSVK